MSVEIISLHLSVGWLVGGTISLELAGLTWEGEPSNHPKRMLIEDCYFELFAFLFQSIFKKSFDSIVSERAETESKNLLGFPKF